MDGWLEIVIRQIMLYSLPVLVSLTAVGWAESRAVGKAMAGPFYAIAWSGTWLPWLASIALHRGLIIALPQPLVAGPSAALARLLAHGVLAALGFLLYAWSLHHPAATGLPPLHHWWAKVLMFFNLCMAAMHLLPLPSMLLGEAVVRRWPRLPLAKLWRHSYVVWLFVLLAASPLLDWLLGTALVFPVYAWLAGLATTL